MAKCLAIACLYGTRGEFQFDDGRSLSQITLSSLLKGRYSLMLYKIIEITVLYFREGN